jgi:hypothetical protein
MVEPLEGRQLLSTFTALEVKKDVAEIQGNHIAVTADIAGQHNGVSANVVGKHIG